ncbi:MAG: hypothetical protein MPN21_23050 [Thermoanaerobaculia bacterium]|nr:hypothetical protein [Thermoanaerobaculia bacterium]
MTWAMILAASCAGGPAAEAGPEEAWTRPSTLDEFFDGSWPRVIAHRGFSAEAPENTMVAIEKAIEARADMVEFDVLLSRDGEVVLIHDETLDRTTDGRGRVADRDLASLRELDAGAWFGANSSGERFAGERIPTLGDVLDATAGRILINVEIKTEAIFDLPNDSTVDEISALLATSLPGRVAEEIRQRGLVDQVIVSSFDPRALDQLRRIAPEIRRASLFDPELHAGRLPRQVTREVDAFGFNVGSRHLTEAMLADAATAGLPVSVYTVDDRREMRRLLERGVRAIFTNRPDVMRRLVRPESASPPP